MGGLLLMLAGCGFQPMYAERGTYGTGQISPNVPNNVAIAPLEDRIGQQLHNALRGRLNPRGQPTDPAYRLEVSINSATEPSTLRSDGTATRRSFGLSANWRLVSVADRDVRFSSSTRANSSYNVVDQPYATRAAFEDAQERAVDLVARDIANRVSGVLAGGELAERSDARE